MFFHSVSFENYVFDIDQIESSDIKNKVSLEYLINHSLTNKDIFYFFMTILLCNSIEVIDNQYISNSPDELALLDFAKKCGFELIDSDSQHVIISSNNVQSQIECPIHFDFTSKRKRSSVLCNIQNKWILLVKGADSHILPRCNNNNSSFNQRLTELGRKGLRTLCFAYKEFGDDEAISLIKEIHQIQAQTIGVDEAIELISERIELGLTLFAFSGVEDELQDNVQETLAIIHDANIKVWMLTGDRLDTAIDVGRNCGLIQPFHSILTINPINNQQESSSSNNDLNSDVLNDLEFAINGQIFDISSINEIDVAQLVLCVDDMDLIMNDLRLFHLASQCNSVILSRCEPLQKGNCIRYFKENIKTIEKMRASALSLRELQPLNGHNLAQNEDEITCHYFFDSFFNLHQAPIVLAIGDGANDVDMIRCADVGIGVEGREGSAAVLSSDYSIPSFSKLSRLLIVHGRWNCIRTSLLILITFLNCSMDFIMGFRQHPYLILASSRCIMLF